MSSNFFSQQDLARRNTRLLVVLFSVAVLLLILLTNVIALVTLGFVNPETLKDNFDWHTLPWPVVSTISIVVIGAVSIAILLKWNALRHGGRAIAQSLGGERITPDSKDPLQRRLLNVVEEMALAANVPVPPVFLLPEAGINAFAAGYSPADAVIGITRGALQQLSRDELQGVIAHEFSHILNGDMRMNIRLIAILNGILFIGHIGYYLLRSGSTAQRASRSRDSKNGGGNIFFLALGLIIVGYLGSFLGNIIKAAVSRQREFLADASAVQFTRNSRGIASALKVIGSHSSHSRIMNRNADENSHLFFGEAISRWTSIFATHPPLAIRIKRLEPHWNGKFPSARPPEQITTEVEQTAPKLTETPMTGTASQPVRSNSDALLQVALPLLILHSSRQQQPACALICCLLLQSDFQVRAQQLAKIKELGGQDLLQQVDQLCDEVEQLSLLQQVQLMQRVIPALKTQSATEFARFSKLIQALVAVLPQPTLSVWLVGQFIEHTVATEFDQTKLVRNYSSQNLIDVQPQVLMLLALISSVAGEHDAQQQAWRAALDRLKCGTDTTKPAVDFKALSTGLPTLLALPPQTKQQLWQAITACVQADDMVAMQEQALLLALALLLEIPYAPPL